MAEAAKEGAGVIINEVITSSNTTISSLTPPPTARNNKRGLDHGTIAKTALKRVEESYGFVMRDKKTIQAIKEGVQDGMESLLPFTSSTRKKSSTDSQKPPFQTAKQATHHWSLLDSTKCDIKKRYSEALKFATKLHVNGGGSLCKIASEMNTTYKLGWEWKIPDKTLCKNTDPNHPEQVI